MNSVVIVFAVCLAVAHAGIIAHTGIVSHDIIAPIAHGAIIQGPGSRTALAGPDGSHIAAVAPGGIVRVAGVGIGPVAVAAAPAVVAGPVAIGLGHGIIH